LTLRAIRIELRKQVIFQRNGKANDFRHDGSVECQKERSDRENRDGRTIFRIPNKTYSSRSA
jgi:hypothetical protein